MIEQSTYEKPHSFAEAVQWLVENDNGLDYEVVIDGSSGALMSRATYIECVKDHSLMNDDGFGEQVNAEGHLFGPWIYPSQVADLSPDCVYVHWYNK